jgi:hypothetical protein
MGDDDAILPAGRRTHPEFDGLHAAQSGEQSAAHLIIRPVEAQRIV